MRRMLLLLVVGGTACAQAHQDTSLGGRPDSGGIVVHDSDTGGGDDGTPIDASMHPIDTPMGGTATLSQTTANNDTLVGLACGNYTTGYTGVNSFYRVFPLTSYGGHFHVTSVDFLVSEASGSPQLTVSIGTYTGTAGGQTINSSGITLLQSTTYTPPNTTTAVPAHVEITGDVTGQLLVAVEQRTAGSATNLREFYPGANEAGESAPSYFLAPDCSITTPTSMDALAQSQTTPTHSNMVLTATGTY